MILSSPEDKKPDIVAYDKENHRVLVWDPTVDLTDLDEAEANKCRKYDVEDVKKWLNEKFPRKSLIYGSKHLVIEFAGIALNWRCAFSKAWYSALKKVAFS